MVWQAWVDTITLRLLVSVFPEIVYNIEYLVKAAK